MAELLFSNRPLNPHQLLQQRLISAGELEVLEASCPLSRPYDPHLVGRGFGVEDQGILSTFRGAPRQVRQNLTEMCLDFSEDGMAALAEMMEELRSELSTTTMGAGTAVYAERMTAFGRAVQKYQGGLMRYRQAVRSGASAAVKNMAKQNVEMVFEQMQREFRHELAAVTTRIRARRGVPLNDSQRALNIARSSRTAVKLNVSSQAHASQLISFSKYATRLGNGLVVIDFASRVGNVHNSYQSGGSWERDLFIESSSFAMSTTVGVLTAKAGVAAVGFLLVATPVGWVGLLVAGAVVAGASAAAAIGTNHFVKQNAGSTYDSIMTRISN